MVPGRSKTYHKVTTSLTAEQHAWIRRVAAQAQLEGVSITAADVIRLALTRLQDQLAERDLRTEFIAHVLKEVEHYPGRANRGLPKPTGSPRRS
jgi:DNA polymerase I-like protein with 3'-5' exonuclease and polymerase domains